MAVPNLSEIVTTTIQNRSKKLADNVTNNNALLLRLRRKGNNRTLSGGNTILQELDFQENSTYKRYSGYETLDISPSEVISSAEFQWKQAAVAVSISGLEELQNSGKEQMIDLLEARITNAERTFANNIASDIYSDGTADGSKQIGGLQHIVADAAGGQVGGIPRGTYTFWENIRLDASDEGAAATSANIQPYMNQLWVQLVRGTDKPDLIVADDAYWRLYLESLQSIQRINSDEMAQAGFMSLKYMGADVVLDGGVGANAPASHMYFLNTNYIFFKSHSKRNMVPLNPDRYAVNQDALVKLIAWAGNMTVSNCSLQGVFKA